MSPTSHSILILSFHLRQALPSGLLPSCFPTKTLYTPLLSSHTCYMLRLSLSSLLDHPNNTGGGVHIIKWVPVTTAWRVLRLQIEEWLPVWRIAANILNKQSRIAEKGWPSNLGGWARCYLLLAVKTNNVANRWQRNLWTWTETSVRPKQWKSDMRSR